MSEPRSVAGFTLIELIVALTLSGLALALVAGSVWSAVETRVRQAASVDADQRARVTREFLRQAVRGLATERSGRDELIALETGTPPRLRLSSRGGAVFGWDADLKQIEIGIDQDPGTRQTGLVARVDRSGTGVPADTLVLLPEATEFGVRLLDDRGTWQGEWPDRTRVPDAVEFRFAGGGTSRLEALPLQVRVP